MKRKQNLCLVRGELVCATRHLDPEGASVRPGTLGVVFEEANAYGDGNGPMVRWFTGGCCNVYPGDIENDRDEFKKYME